MHICFPTHHQCVVYCWEKKINFPLRNIEAAADDSLIKKAKQTSHLSLFVALQLFVFFSLFVTWVTLLID